MSTTGDNENTRAGAPSPHPELDDLPLGIGLAFERDLFASARETLLRHARDRARVGTGSECEALAREADMVELVALATPDDDVRNAASTARLQALTLLSQTPAATLSDTACKLAALVHELAESVGRSPLSDTCFTLMASVLADLTLLRAGPLTPPPGCELPITTAEDVERWRAVAASREART
jgi:hypothetical protein